MLVYADVIKKQAYQLPTTAENLDQFLIESLKNIYAMHICFIQIKTTESLTPKI